MTKMTPGDIHVQQFSLGPNVDQQRFSLDWGGLQRGAEDWKCLSLVRYKPTWIQPQTHPRLAAHPNLASNLILLRSPEPEPGSGSSVTLGIYPISTLGTHNNLVVEAGEVKANVRRVKPGPGSREGVWVVCGRADNRVDERSLVERLVDKARRLVRAGSEADPSSETRKDAVFDGLGICTWESFLQPTVKAVALKLRVVNCGDRDRPSLELLLSLIPPFYIKSFLIDDGWQHVSQLGQAGRLVSFGPWEGMGAPMPRVIRAIKDKGAEKVGVWVTLAGYWYGIDPDSELAKRYDCQEYKVGVFDGGRGGVSEPRADGKSMWLPSVDKAEAFWRDWFTEMKSWGVDFVKVDNQAFQETIIGPGSLHVQQALWSGMLSALADTWSTEDIIMCMSHNERMLNGPGGLDFDRPGGRLVFRNTDDFALGYPNDHPDHLHWNVYNTILTRHLFVPDFDMFASAPSALLPTYHALLRALGPGPILLSDTPRVQSDHELIRKLTGQTRSGREEVVRAPEAVQVLSGRWFLDDLKGRDEGPALVGGAKFGDFGGIIGAWNVHDAGSGGVARDEIGYQDVQDVMGLSDDDKDEWIVSPLGLVSERSPPFTLMGGESGAGTVDGKVALALSEGECEGFVVGKVFELNDNVKVAIIGLRDKFAKLAGITDVRVDQKGNSLLLSSRFAGKLTFLIYDCRPTSVDGWQASIDGRPCSLDSSGTTLYGRETLAASVVELDIGTGTIPIPSVVGAGDRGWEVRLQPRALGERTSSQGI